MLLGMPDQRSAQAAAPAKRQPFGMYRICLVCLGNICRSPMAEVLLREEVARAGLAGAVTVESAGTGDWHIGQGMYAGARAELARRGYDGSAHRARQVRRSWLAEYDLVLAMDADNLADLRKMAPDAETAGRVRLFRSFDPGLSLNDPYRAEVPDPYGGTPEEFAVVFDLIHAAARGVAARLAEVLATPGRA
jgi:low molecular weight protein-tyrosine phosphatase